MTTTHSEIWDLLVNAQTEEEWSALDEMIGSGAYTTFNRLLSTLKEQFTKATEGDIEQMREIIRRGRRLVPEPARISPSWEKVWVEYERMIDFKLQALQSVPHSEREGEWQIVMDNPYTNDPISCYPGLSFIEAAYLYAYFRKDLKPNEYLRLQKITNLLITSGN